MPDSTMDQIPLRELSRRQRRVLGTLLEKAFTTPDQYPLTLKATVAGCNQKSNREPTTNYDEDDVQKALEELREIGFVGEVHTDGGRAARYRHYLRHRTSLTEPQLAVMTELMLRGRQQLGELRTRASRMVNIPTQDELRTTLQELLDLKMVRASGPLERRGIEVDHALYVPNERPEAFSAAVEEPASFSPVQQSPVQPAVGTRDAVPAPAHGSPLIASAPVASHDLQLSDTVAELKEQVSELRQELSDLKDELADLRRQLGA